MYILIGMVLSFLGMMGAIFFSRFKTKNEILFAKTSDPKDLSRMGTYAKLALFSGVMIFAGAIVMTFNLLTWT